jgi:hypothetical protein
MIGTCQPFPRAAAEEMLQIVARATCDRPGDSAAQRESRTNQMVHATLGMEPRDGLEFMVSSLLFGHFNLILDSMRDVFQGQTDSLKAKTKAGIVGLDRSMLALVKELRESKARPLAKWAEDAKRADVAASAAPPPAKATTPDEPDEFVPEMDQSVESVPPPEATEHQPESVDEISVVAPRSDDVALEEDIAAYQEALAGAQESRAGADARDDVKRQRATGD